MIVATPRPSSPTRWATASSSRISAEAFERLPSLSLSRSIRKPFRAPSVEHSRNEEARQPVGRLRENEERVAHRRRAEPLLAGEHVVRRPSGSAPGLVGAHVRAALPLGHRHPAERAALVGRRAQAGVVGDRREPAAPTPAARSGAPRAQGGHRREGHRERAPDARLGVRERHEERAAHDVAPLPGSRHGSACSPCSTPRPRSRCQAGWNSTSSIRSPKRSCVRRTGGCSFASRPSSSGSPPQSLPECRAALLRGAAALAPKRLDERPVLGEQVVPLERRRLVRGAEAGRGHQIVLNWSNMSLQPR